MERIVVGTDGSPGAANAMRWAARLAAFQGAELVVMTACVPAQAELPPERAAALLDERRAQLEEWSAAARVGDLAVRTVVEDGDPRPGILAVAEREQADLIVVGRAGTSAGPGLLRIGSVAEWLAHHADRGVAVVGGAVNLTTQRVLVGVDGSPASRAAVEWVRRLGASSAMHVIAASVHEPLLEWTPADSPQNWRRGLEEQIASDLAAPLFDAAMDVEARACAGANVADALLQAAGDERADLVVVGTRGLGGFTGLRIGGVALKVLHRADRPVVLVPPAP
jgi:nucleotide-binding universal stress UspA family protein